MLWDAFLNLISEILLMIGYVSGNHSFPNPLTPEEEKKYISLYQKGDMEARNILIEHNLRLVAHIAKKYASSDHDLDDLISIGTIGLIKAISTFNPDKNSRLATYAAHCIKNEMLMVLRSNKKLSHEISIDDTIGTDKEGNTLTFSDILSAENLDIAENLFDKIETQKLYRAIYTVLKKNEADILCWHYGLNNSKKKTQKEIASILGISRSYVSRIEKKALQKLLAAMDENK
ncbi:MAG: RNA polymerase sporulation sigma factor SigK [Clostridia bacterium]|nr:RNA polymerase sporulation sigma factor SigK [Clostridia bacterium]